MIIRKRPRDISLHCKQYTTHTSQTCLTFLPATAFATFAGKGGIQTKTSSGCRSQSPGVSFFRTGRCRKSQICRRNCSDICHTVGDISTSGMDSHTAIFGYPSMSHLFVDTFFDFGVVENFVYSSRIKVIFTSDLSGCISLWLWLCSIDDDLLQPPVLSIILKMYKYRCLHSCQIMLSFAVSNIQKCHVCEVYIFAS